MNDLTLIWGGDLSLSPNNDLALGAGDNLVQQRLIRRLFTTCPDYFWESNYGAGLGAAVGSPLREGAITALIQNQIAMESTIASNPPARISVAAEAFNLFSVAISYTANETNTSSTLSFTVGS